ncbi:MAG: hypothetical protein ACJA0G_002409 [Kangiellaceae bacterium]|jgi:hypothetical protein
MICDEEELIGRNMFAIDAGGPARCKIKSNASKRIIERHQAQDGLGEELVIHDVKQKEKLDKSADKITTFLAIH